MTCSRCPSPAFLRIDANTVLCASCWKEVEDRFVAALESVSPPLFGETAVAASSPPCPEASTACNFKSALAPVMAADTATASDLTDPPVAVAVNNSFPDFPEFLKRSNATTLRVAADSSIQVSDSSLSIPGSKPSAVVSAHNTIVRSA